MGVGDSSSSGALFSVPCVGLSAPIFRYMVRSLCCLAIQLLIYTLLANGSADFIGDVCKDGCKDGDGIGRVSVSNVGKVCPGLSRGVLEFQNVPWRNSQGMVKNPSYTGPK